MLCVQLAVWWYAVLCVRLTCVVYAVSACQTAIEDIKTEIEVQQFVHELSKAGNEGERRSGTARRSAAPFTCTFVLGGAGHVSFSSDFAATNFFPLCLFSDFVTREFRIDNLAFPKTDSESNATSPFPRWGRCCGLAAVVASSNAHRREVCEPPLFVFSDAKAASILEERLRQCAIVCETHTLTK